MLRLIIALGISFMLFPTVEKDNTDAISVIDAPSVQTPSVSTFDTFSAVNSVIQDISYFCHRNEEACITGNAIITSAHGIAQSTLNELLKGDLKPTQSTVSAINVSLAQ